MLILLLDVDFFYLSCVYFEKSKQDQGRSIIMSLRFKYVEFKKISVISGDWMLVK